MLTEYAPSNRHRSADFVPSQRIVASKAGIVLVEEAFCQPEEDDVAPSETQQGGVGARVESTVVGLRTHNPTGVPHQINSAGTENRRQIVLKIRLEFRMDQLFRHN